MASPRVLLADDDEAVLCLMQHQLERCGWEVTSAKSVPEALNLITTQPFDALVTDLRMPNDGDGIFRCGYFPNSAQILWQ